ncbi:MAG: prealbumin-like fold domain-containing protein [Streptomycetaceae bacterium]|nr:prealbumin-like fold domain-containing protein [Streptomycetaceae bacterium]
MNLVVATGVMTVMSMGPAGANLAGSTFEGNDGNLVVNTAGNTDWDNAPNRVVKVEQNTGTADDSFGGGSKEDLPNPTVGTGSIPPNKSDLSRFYVSHDTSGGNFFLNLAWERTNVLGSANMDFEFNKLSALDPNGVTPQRSPGDMLITFDFTNGGGNPVLGLLRWVTTGPTSQCFKNNSLPCWGNRVNLSAAGFAEGQVNTGPVSDPVPPGAPRTLPALTFGEASINLTAAGIFQPGQCLNFASAYLKSRSSAAFDSELKDFIAPANAMVSNCGRIRVHKMTDPSGAAGSFGFTTTGGLSPAGFSLGDSGLQDYQNVPVGQYTITESNPAPAFDLTDLQCTSDSANPNIGISGATATIGLRADETVDCTYVNRQRGTIVIQKVTDPSSDTTTSFEFTPSANLSPDKFNLVGGGAKTFTNVVPGSNYSVAESVPAGWDLTSATCDNGSPVTAITVAAGQTTTCTFNDRQRGSITITKTDDAGAPLAGATFTLYVDNTPFDNAPPHGSEDTATSQTCTTGADGKCTIGDVAPGQYWVVENAPGVPGHDLAPDQHVVVNSSADIPLTFVDKRRFTVITLVCEESSNTLHPSTVTVDGVDKTSLAANGGGSISDADLCALGGARFEGKNTGDHPGNVNIP